MNRPRLIALDLDGTLLTSAHVVSSRAEAAIRALTAAGVLIVLSTGRPTRMTTPLVGSLGLEHALVYNGAAHYRASTGAVDLHHALDRAAGLAIIERLRARMPEIRLGIETGSGWYLDPDLEARRRAHPRLAAMSPPNGVGPVEDFVSADVIKVFGRHPTLGADEMARALEGLDVYATWTTLEMLEVMHAGVNKRTALEALAARLGISQAETAAFGDQHNDVEVLAWAGQGIAMANAGEAVRTAADEVTASNDEEGVALVLERWL